MPRWLPLLAALPALSLAATVYPDPDWPVATDYKAVETAPGRLEQYRKWLETRAGDYWAAVVIKGGRLVFEGRGPRCHVRQKNDCGSILKPLQSTVLGAALYQGRLKSVDENAMRYWLDPYVTPYPNDREITFRQFAQFQDRWNEPEAAGTYRYNNSGATAAGACLAGLFGTVRGPRPKGIAEVARTQVMEKIRADWDLWYWESDFSGNPGNAGPRMVLDSSVYELAKLGYLWLRKGLWKQTRIFSESYYNEATTDWSPNTGSETFGFYGHYGYWWFVNTRQKLLPGVPADAFYHIGNGSPGSRHDVVDYSQLRYRSGAKHGTTLRSE